MVLSPCVAKHPLSTQYALCPYNQLSLYILKGIVPSDTENLAFIAGAVFLRYGYCFNL